MTRCIAYSLLRAGLALGILVVGAHLALADEGKKFADCSTPLAPTHADSGVVAISTHKIWQARGGEIDFDVRASQDIPPNSLIRICFAWEADGRPQAFVEARPARILAIAADRTLTVRSQVPDLPAAPPRWSRSANDLVGVGTYQGFWLVPVADARILLTDSNGGVVVDAMVPVGVTSTWLAGGVGIGVVVVALVLLSLVKLPQPKSCGPLLRLIATVDGFASLSQFQILLWVLVVGASAAYVMALSGDLIAITSGTLILLGISGVATLGSKLHDVREESALGVAAAPPPAAPGAGPRQPKWTDLVIAEGEIDVTRVQMLFFTLITAAFVAMKVATSYEIPAIPDGFLTLMGISNGVYIGSKFIR